MTITARLTLLLFLSFMPAAAAQPSSPTAARTADPELLSLEERLLDLARSEVSTPSAYSSAITALGHPDPRLRYWAAQALGARQHRASVEPLLALVKDDDKYVRSAVFTALGRIADPRATGAAKAALEDPEEVVRLAALLALLGTEGEVAALGRYDPERRILKRESAPSAKEEAAAPTTAPDESYLIHKRKEAWGIHELQQHEEGPAGELGKKILKLKQKQARQGLSPGELSALRGLVAELPYSKLNSAMSWLQSYHEGERLLVPMLALSREALDRAFFALHAREYQALLVPHPRSPLAHYRMGQIHFWSGDRGSAIKALDQAVALAPQHKKAHVLLVRVLIDAGDYTEGAKYARIAHSLGADVKNEIQTLKEKGHWPANAGPATRARAKPGR